MNKAIKLALKTWYPPDHPLHNDPLHPALGLAGEAGELLDLYKKERFKDGVSWWDCVHCGKDKDSHTFNNLSDVLWCSPYAPRIPFNYTPKILDELGDFWYYLRILAYQFELSFAIPLLQTSIPRLEVILSELNTGCALFLQSQIMNIVTRNEKLARLDGINYYFHMLLRELNFTLDQVTESNWQKLKDGDNHGWKVASRFEGYGPEITESNWQK